MSAHDQSEIRSRLPAINHENYFTRTASIYKLSATRPSNGTARLSLRSTSEVCTIARYLAGISRTSLGWMFREKYPSTLSSDGPIFC